MKLALVTGGATRLGAQIAEYLAQNGWDLIVHYNQSKDEAESLGRRLFSDYKVKVELIQADFSNETEIMRMISQISTKVSLVVNNAALFENDKQDNWDRVFSVNVRAPYLLSKYFAQKSAPNIINILDYIVEAYCDNFFAYSASKAALAHLTKQMAVNFAPSTRVNAIALGHYLIGKNETELHFNKVVDASLLKRPTSPQEIINCIGLVLQTFSLTGQILFLDSGKSLHRVDY